MGYKGIFIAWACLHDNDDRGIVVHQDINNGDLVDINNGDNRVAGDNAPIAEISNITSSL